MIRVLVVMVFCLSINCSLARADWPIRNSKLLCVTGGELTEVGKVINGRLQILNFEKVLDSLDRRLLKIERNLDLFLVKGSFGRLNKLEKRYDRLVVRYNSLLDCYYDENGQDPAPDPDTNPGFDPTPAPTPAPTAAPETPQPPTGSACSAFAGTSVRIINGVVCSGASAVVEIMINNQSGCSGTLVTPSLVVTAAHCVEDKPRQLAVSSTSGSSVVASYHVHPNYGNNEDHDVAVLLLQNQLSGPTMSILEPDSIAAGTTSAIAGYGEDESKDYGTLKAGYLVIGQASTNSIVGYYSGLNKGSDSNTCYGDSGGPLVVQANGAWYLAGVTSSGSNDSCGVDGRADQVNLCEGKFGI